MRVLKSFKKFPKRQQILLICFAFILILAIVAFFWGAFTGRIMPFALGNTQITNTATITYSGLTTPISSNTVVVTVDNPPGPPTGVLASAISSTSINITWVAPSDTDVASYNVYRDNVQIKSGLTTRSYLDKSLNPSTTYSYQVTAVDGVANESAKSSASQATTLASDNPNLIEAESMTLSRFEISAYSWASGGNVIKLLSSAGITGTATKSFTGLTGKYDVKVFYNDENDGVCTFRLYINNSVVDEWQANQDLGSSDPLIGNLVSRTKTSVDIANLQEIKLEAIQAGNEWARIDKIELTPSSAVSLNINLSLPSASSANTSGTKLTVYPAGTTTSVYENDNISTNSSGQATIDASISGTSFDFKLQSPGFLVKILRNITLINPLNLQFGTLRAGDIDGDNYVVMADFILFRNSYGSQNSIADFDRDGTVTLSDFIIFRPKGLQEGDK